jgi:hypothetical protein
LNKRQSKKKMKKQLSKARLVIRKSGMLGGYFCPNCLYGKLVEPFCPRCEQNLRYNIAQLNEPNLWKSNKEWESKSKQRFDKTN